MDGGGTRSDLLWGVPLAGGLERLREIDLETRRGIRAAELALALRRHLELLDDFPKAALVSEAQRGAA